MKKFVFMLNSLLNITIKEEKNKMIELAQIDVKVYNVENELNILHQEVERLRQACRMTASKLIEIEEKERYNRYLRFKAEHIQNKKNELDVLQKEREGIRNCLIQIMQKKRMLELLREKQFTKYQQEVQQENARQIDEFVAYKSHIEKSNGNFNNKVLT